MTIGREKFLTLGAGSIIAPVQTIASSSRASAAEVHARLGADGMLRPEVFLVTENSINVSCGDVIKLAGGNTVGTAKRKAQFSYDNQTWFDFHNGTPSGYIAYRDWRDDKGKFHTSISGEVTVSTSCWLRVYSEFYGKWGDHKLKINVINGSADKFEILFGRTSPGLQANWYKHEDWVGNFLMYRGANLEIAGGLIAGHDEQKVEYTDYSSGWSYDQPLGWKSWVNGPLGQIHLTKIGSDVSGRTKITGNIYAHKNMRVRVKSEFYGQHITNTIIIGV